MFQIPIRFPSDVELLRNTIEADRLVSFRDRIRAIDGIWNTVDLFVSSVQELPTRNRLRELREAEGHKYIREFIQRQLAKQPADPGTSD